MPLPPALPAQLSAHNLCYDESASSLFQLVTRYNTTQWDISASMFSFVLYKVPDYRCYLHDSVQSVRFYNNLQATSKLQPADPSRAGVQTNANGDTLVACAVSNCDKCCRCHLRYPLNCSVSQQPLLRRNSAFVDPSRVGSNSANGDTLVACAVSNCAKCAAAAATCALLNWVRSLQQPSATTKPAFVDPQPGWSPDQRQWNPLVACAVSNWTSVPAAATCATCSTWFALATSATTKLSLR